MNNSPEISKIWIIAVVLVLLQSMAGCAPPKYIMIQSMDPLMEDMNLSINMNPDIDTVREGMAANLLQIDGFITSAPKTSFLLRASEGYFGYAYSFIEDEDKARASSLYLKAREYALRALLDYNYYQFIAMPFDKYQAELDSFDSSDVPALYWTANSWMAWVGMNVDKPDALNDIPKIEAMLLKVIELDDTYYYGAAHSTLGAFYASRAKSVGGDPEKAREHFDRAFEISESKMLFFHLVYAQYYAYQTQDRDLFEKTLRMVAETPVGYFPEKNFANEVAKKKARKLLEHIDEFF